MRKFFPSFILAFILAIAFLAPVHGVLAITGKFQPSIIPISETKKQISNYSYACPKVASTQPSFFERLLAAVGVARSSPAQRLAESTCSEPSLIQEIVDSSYKCTRVSYKVDSVATTGCAEAYSKLEIKTFSAKYAATYGVTSCSKNHTYNSDPSRSWAIGVIKSWCTGPRAPMPTKELVKYPPTIDVDGDGAFRGRWLVGSNLIEDFAVTESANSNLAVFSDNGANYTTVTVPISVALTQLVLNTKTKEFDRVSVPCTNITVAGKALDKYCRTTVVVDTNRLSGIDVTPKAPVLYYTYSVYVSGAITEK